MPENGSDSSKNQHLTRNPWEVEIQRIVSTKYRIISWQEVREGAIAAVIANDRCVDPAVFMMNGFEEDYLRAHQTEENKFSLFNVVQPFGDSLPNATRMYVGWGTSLVTRRSKKAKELGVYIDNAIRFIKLVEEMNWNDLLGKSDT